MKNIIPSRGFHNFINPHSGCFIIRFATAIICSPYVSSTILPYVAQLIIYLPLALAQQCGDIPECCVFEIRRCSSRLFKIQLCWTPTNTKLMILQPQRSLPFFSPQCYLSTLVSMSFFPMCAMSATWSPNVSWLQPLKSTRLLIP
jgi:hypothetical protein